MEGKMERKVDRKMEVEISGKIKDNQVQENDE